MVASRHRIDAEPMPTQVCTHCGVEKLATPEFFKPNHKMRSGFDSWCRDCYRAGTRAHMARYRQEHHDENLARERDWRKEHPERMAVYAAKHAHKRAAWKAAHPHLQRAYQRQRQARLRGADGTHSAADKAGEAPDGLGWVPAMTSAAHRTHLTDVPPELAARFPHFNLSCLTEKQLAVLERRIVDGWSWQRIAEEMGCRSRGSVGKCLGFALCKLRAQAEDGRTPGA